MKHLSFSVNLTNKNENQKYLILAQQGKALVRGIFTGACFSEKEIFR